jgi:hypothetical protein
LISSTPSTATQELQQRPRRHLRPRHSRCDCGRDERRDREGTRGETQFMMTRRRRCKRMTSNPVAMVRFTPATTEGGC